VAPGKGRRNPVGGALPSGQVCKRAARLRGRLQQQARQPCPRV